jgi:hypothetical protein
MPVTTDTLRVTGKITHANDFFPPVDPGQIAQRDNQETVIDFIGARVWDAFQTNLPGTPATDDLGLIGGTFGTNAPSIQTGDLKAAGATTRYARFQVNLPPEYVAGQTVTLRFAAGMITTIADASATLDVECHLSDEDDTVSADLYVGAAQSINSLTFADKDFTITPATLSPGDMLDVRIAIAVNDAATGTAVIGCVAAMKRVCDTRG